MTGIKILGQGIVDDRDSAFPKAIQMPDGEILCSFCAGGGAEAKGGTELARSKDFGKTWIPGGIILPATESTSNHLKLSLSHDNKTIYAYGGLFHSNSKQKFGEKQCEPVFCTSVDRGYTWSKPHIIENPYNCPLEISYGIVPLESGRLLAPAALLPAPERLGEKVIVFISDDSGQHWDKHSIVFESKDKNEGYFEHKFVELGDGRIMAVCWTVTLGSVKDKENSFSLSFDHGSTWSEPKSTGIMGQTMSPLYLGEDRLIVFYNKRYGEQGIMMALVTFNENEWFIHHEEFLYDAQKERECPENLDSGVTEFDNFAFGFPTAVQLNDGSVLVTYWRKDNGKCCVCWSRLRVDWNKNNN
jgi:hypothetical protein